MLIIQFLENNILTPNIVGYNVNISPFFIIIGLIAGALIWGVPGMLVVVPVLAILRIVLSNVEKYRPYAYLLSRKGTNKYTIHFSKLWKYIRNRIKRD